MLRRDSRGFTFVELTIAAAIFSLLLLVMTSGVIRLFHIYQASAQIRDTQQTARLVSEEVARDVRNASFVVTSLDTAVDPARRHGIICLVALQQQTDAATPSGANAFTGVKYYTQAHGSRQWDLYRVNISMAANGNNPPTPAGCLNATNTTTPEQINHSDTGALNGTTVVQFLGSALPGATGTGKLLSLDMSIASTAGRDLIDYTTPATQPLSCLQQSGAQYCSVTDLHTDLLTHKGIGE